MAEAPSEDGDAAAQSGTAAGARQEPRPAGITGPPGDIGLPPSRPSSAATGHSSRGGWSHAAPSRRGVPPSVAGSTVSTRPPTSHSRTHVPSLTAQAFFRPMSSQRLQAQRNQRPLSLLGQTAVGGTEGQSDTGTPANRASHASGQTIRGPANALALQQDENARPISRGTDTTDMPDRLTENNSPNGADTLRSKGESEAPLHNEPQPPSRSPARLDTNISSNVQPPQKSPRSFRSSFILPARNSRGASRTSVTPRQQGHEKLGSIDSTPQATPQENPKMLSKRALGNNYEYFTGNTVFCWGGRMQNTRDRPISLITAILTVLPGPLFIAQSGVWLWLHVSPAITILYIYLWLITLSSFFHASVTNPGILPRNLHPFPPANPNEDPLTIGPPTTDWTMVISATSKTAAMEVPTKYCKTCNIWRPPRAHHCRVCDNCIETQDHHCVWLNNCVGRRNYRYFFAYVSSGSLLGLYLIAASIAHLALYSTRNHVSFGHAVSKFPLALAMFIYGLLATPYPIALWAYHLGLIARGETTREFLQSHKFRKQDRHRPFTQGNIFKNWIMVLLRPRPPTYLHFKQKYEDGDQRFGERKGKRTTPLAPEQQGGVEMQSIGSRFSRFQGPASRAQRPGAT